MTTNRIENMKAMTAAMMGLTLAVTSLTATAVRGAETDLPASPPCRMGLGQGGPAWSLTAEQRAERQQAMQNYVASLREKKATGTITAPEQAWLDRMEQRGGMCINGVPRGPRGGFGARGTQEHGQGRGRGGMGRGWCGGAGPGANPNCPLLNAPPTR